MSMLEELDGLREQIDAHRPFTSDLVATLQGHLVPRYLYCSGALGKRGYLTEAELTAFVEREIVSGGHPLDRFLGVQRHMGALEFVEERAREGRPVELAFFREVHHQLTSGSRSKSVRPGQWRDHVHPPAQRGRTEFVYSAPERIAETMKALVAQLDQRLTEGHPVEAVAWLYYQFHLVHPFGRENGAVARLAATCALLNAGYPHLVVEPDAVGELLAALASCAPVNRPQVEALEDDVKVTPLVNFFVRCLIRTATELLDLLEGRAIATAADLSRQIPEDQGRVLRHVVQSPSVSWRVRSGLEVRTLHERLRRLVLTAVCQGPLYEIRLVESDVSPSHKLAGSRLGARLPGADAGVVGETSVEVIGLPELGLRMPPPFRLKLVTVGTQHGLHVMASWAEEEKITDHHGPARAVEWPDKDLNRLLVQELDERRRRFELLLIDENLAPAAQGRIREALGLAPGQAPRRRTGTFNRQFLVQRTPPQLIPDAEETVSRPATVRPTPAKNTLRLDARGCPSCRLQVKTGEGLTCPDCQAVYHEVCLARLPGCLSASCLVKRKTAESPRRQVSGKASRETLDGLRPSEPPISF